MNGHAFSYSQRKRNQPGLLTMVTSKAFELYNGKLEIRDSFEVVNKLFQALGRSIRIALYAFGANSKRWWQKTSIPKTWQFHEKRLRQKPSTPFEGRLTLMIRMSFRRLKRCSKRSQDGGCEEQGLNSCRWLPECVHISAACPMTGHGDRLSEIS